MSMGIIRFDAVFAKDFKIQIDVGHHVLVTEINKFI